MISMECDNKDGSINWENRASILVITQLLAGVKKKAQLEAIKDKKSQLYLEVVKKWKRIEKQMKDE